MKNLKDSILEKLKVDDIIFNEFPINGALDNIVKFLKEQGFEDISDKLNKSIYDIIDDAKKKVYFIIESQIFFADTSKEKTSARNPIFFCTEKGSLNIFYFDFINNHYVDIIKIGRDNNTKKAFMKELNKQFGWV